MNGGHRFGVGHGSTSTFQDDARPAAYNATPVPTTKSTAV